MLFECVEWSVFDCQDWLKPSVFQTAVSKSSDINWKCSWPANGTHILTITCTQRFRRSRLGV